MVMVFIKRYLSWIYLAVAISMMAGSFFAGMKINEGKWQKDKAASLARLIEQYDQQIAIDAEIYEEHLHVEHKTRVEYRVLEQEAEAVRAPDCRALGDEWRRVFDAAIPTGKADAAAVHD